MPPVFDYGIYMENEIVNERVVAYINSLNTKNRDIVEAIEKEARETGVPIIRKEVENFIKVMLKMNSPKRILEVGAAVGYSAIFMAENMDADYHITTIELDPKRAELARENIKKAGLEDKISLIEGDASKILPELDGEFDYIFLDAAKGQYKVFWEPLVKLCKQGGTIVTDNVLQEGTIVESRYMIEQRDRTIHVRMREFLYELTHSAEFTSSILPLGDGLAISIKN